MTPIPLGRISGFILVWLMASGSVAAARGDEPVRLTLGNLLATFQGDLYEITRDGTVLQQIPVPSGGGGPLEMPRDVVVDSRGRVHVFNGSRFPVLSTLNPVTGVWSERTLPDWNVTNNIAYGGLAVDGHRVLAGDMRVGDDPGGLVVFDLGSGDPAGFRPEGIPFSFIDLSLGGTGEVCGLEAFRRVHCYSLRDFSPLRTVTLETPVRSISLDTDGSFFAAATTGGRLLRFDPAGNLVADSGGIINSIQDVDIDGLGRVIAGSRSGNLVVASRDFSTIEVLEPFADAPPGQDQTFVGFVGSVPPVVEVPALRPAGAVLLVLALLGFGLLRLRSAALARASSADPSS